MMKKKILIIAVIVVLVTVICFLYNTHLSRPSTNLEFWIGEKVKNVNFSQYQEKPGLMGGREFYGKGYQPLIHEDGERTDPEYCVIYTVTSYPDHMSNSPHITHILITDPSIEIYDLTLESRIEDIEKRMKREGYRIEYSAGGLTARKGRFTIVFAKNSISLDAKVTNFWGIQF